MPAIKTKKPKTNPHCPVPGCRTKHPHADDPAVKGMLIEFGPPEKMTSWVLAAMADLAQSIARDMKEKKIFAWFARLRQPEELYIRTLYTLFIAAEEEIPHIFSGEWPNGLTGYYKKVNEIVFGGRGMLDVDQPGLNSGTFKPIDTLHMGAHASFPAMMTCLGLARDPKLLPPADDYLTHLETYLKYLDHMHGLFEAGRNKKDVLSALINLHRPAG